jgi:hypothetical protein
MDGIHKSIIWVALGMIAATLVRPLLASFLNPILASVKLAL